MDDWEYLRRRNLDSFMPNEQQYIQPTTQILRYSNELERDEILADEDFFRRHPDIIREINKFLPLSNIRSYKTIRLLQRRRKNYINYRRMGLTELAEITNLLNIADLHTTRGQDGFNSKLMVTNIQKVIEEKKKEGEKRGFLGNLRQKNEEEEEFMV